MRTLRVSPPVTFSFEVLRKPFQRGIVRRFDLKITLTLHDPQSTLRCLPEQDACAVNSQQSSYANPTHAMLQVPGNRCLGTETFGVWSAYFAESRCRNPTLTKENSVRRGGRGLNQGPTCPNVMMAQRRPGTPNRLLTWSRKENSAL